jgi:hypothetical protein
MADPVPDRWRSTTRGRARRAGIVAREYATLLSVGQFGFTLADIGI